MRPIARHKNATCSLPLARAFPTAWPATARNSPLEQKIIHIDIDPAEMDKNLFAEFHLRGDLKEVFQRLGEVLPPMEHAAWRAQAAAFRQPQPAAPADGFPTPQQVIETLARLTPDNAQIVTDVGQHQMWTAQYYPFEQPRTFITSGGLGAMGFGLGASIGACLAHPERKNHPCQRRRQLPYEFK